MDGNPIAFERLVGGERQVESRDEKKDELCCFRA